MGTLRIMGGMRHEIMAEVNAKLSPLERVASKGDLPVEWDPNNIKETDYARQIFDAARAKGFSCIVGGKTVTQFDPGAGEMDLVPRMAGG